MVQPATLIEREAAWDKKYQHLLWLRCFEGTVAAAAAAAAAAADVPKWAMECCSY